MPTSSELRVWEHFCAPDLTGHPGIHPAPRSASAALTTPSARLLQIQQELNLAKTYLGEAVRAIRRFQDLDALIHDTERSSFGGVPMSQYWVDMLLWEAVLNSNPHVTSICELGTGYGGFSRFLYAQAEARGLRFRSYDSIPAPDPPDWFTRADVFLEQDVILAWIGSEPTVLFCDDGNKPRELREYAPVLPNGSLVIVHDWDVEVTEEHVPDCLEEVHADFCDLLDSVSRVFQRKGSI